MNRKMIGFGLASLTILLTAGPSHAHHVMGGRLPESFTDGLLSGLGHPIIGLDHFAAVVAVGCLAAVHRAAPALIVAFVLAMMGGVALHLQGIDLIEAELVVALSVIVLGLVLLTGRPLTVYAALIVFAAVGLVHGYALAESIVGAERAPLSAYLAGLAVIQSAIGLGAMWIARWVARRRPDRVPLRIAGATIAGFGLAIVAYQFI